MKIKIFLQTLLFFFLSLSAISAQVNNQKKTIDKKPIKKEIGKENGTGETKSPLTTGDETYFRDDEGNQLIIINDEGTVGSITIPSGSSIPSTTTNKLYNVGNTLYFNGNSLGAAGHPSVINDLSDAIFDGSSLFLGSGAGVNDDETDNNNTAMGFGALHSNTSGDFNTAIGYYSLYSNTAGGGNTAIGIVSLYYNKTGSNNTATGDQTLHSNTTGGYNTANGAQALFANTIGSSNTAIGDATLSHNTTGNSNTADGASALSSNITGSFNTADGEGALASNDIGSFNTANGGKSLNLNTSGNNNTANGFEALYSNTTGFNNTANGYQALYSNITAGNNTANGYHALYKNSIGSANTACGSSSLSENTTGSGNTAVGYNCGPNSSNLSNTTALGYNAQVTASNQVRIGNSSVTSIGGYQNWTNISDIRFKKNIKENVIGLDFIMGLKPITYNLDVNAIVEKLGEDMRLDKSGNRIKVQSGDLELASRGKKASIRQSGFSAQDVEALAEKLGYDFGGVDKPENENGFYGLRYSEFVVPLVKAVQEQQKIIEDAKNTIEAQQQELNELKEEMLMIKKELNSKQLADANN